MSKKKLSSMKVGTFVQNCVNNELYVNSDEWYLVSCQFKPMERTCTYCDILTIEKSQFYNNWYGWIRVYHLTALTFNKDQRRHQ